MISFVSFVKPVTIGVHGRETWAAKSEAASVGHGKTTCAWHNRGLLFTYEAGDVKQRITVPLTNIAQVTEIGDDEPQEKKK